MKKHRLLFGMLLTGSLFLSSFSTSSAAQDDAKASPVNGRTYAMEQVKNYFETFEAAYQCAEKYIPTEQNVSKYTLFYNVHNKCLNLILKAMDFRLDITTRPNLIFENENEKNFILADASLIEANQKLMYEFWQMILYFTKDVNKAHSAISFAVQLSDWYQDVREKYNQSFTEIRKLMIDYNNEKLKCSEYTRYIDCSAGLLKSMKKILEQMAQYFTYDVDTQVLGLKSKGRFIIDYDNYSRNLIAHNKDYLAILDSCMDDVNKMRDRITKQHVGVLGMVKLRNKSIFSPLIGKYPEHVEALNDKLYTYMGNVHLFVKELHMGPIGKFLTKAKFDDSGNNSSFRSLEVTLAKTLLKGKDKDGNVIKHNVGK